MNLKYFFTKEYCSCPLNSLSPEEIKKSYSNELSKYDIKKVRYLNLVSKTLGFQDWTNYQKEYTNKLLPFLKENELKVYAPNNRINILKSKHGDINFSYRKIADRIFLSNQPMPKKIFTGYGCKIDNFLINYRLPPIIINDKIFTNIDELHKDRKDIVSLIKSEIYCNIKENLELDYLITSLSIFISLQNLIGDTFIIDDKKEKEHIGCLYQNKIGLSQEYDFQEIGDIFHKQLLEMNKGWIEIIPFNNNLIFLKASDGNYDFWRGNLNTDTF
ncbi:hypothetical protein [Aliarcobacter butzleri]|uniref:hypothetical protein n=1 Tax=Aliarcobacter butzleri TaxID=28197 RepID=UPI00273A404E|nr:hypothetical protein [Aliarcobacter butzleri]